jgi:hypothetical protein
MNVHLIETFSEMADGYADLKTSMPGEYHPDWHTLRDTRFAELVITDVLDILASYRTKVVFYDGIEHNCQHPIHAIKTHFGVEP